MFWKNERTEYGWVTREKVQMYECQFSCMADDGKGKQRRHNMRCLVVCDMVEEAIAACRKQWPHDFVLHSVHKRNQSCDLIVADSVLETAESPT